MTKKNFTVTIENLETGRIDTHELEGFCLLHVHTETEDDFVGNHHVSHMTAAQLAQIYQQVAQKLGGVRAAEARLLLERVEKGLGFDETEPCDCSECSAQRMSVEEVPEA